MKRKYQLKSDGNVWHILVAGNPLDVTYRELDVALKVLKSLESLEIQNGGSLEIPETREEIEADIEAERYHQEVFYRGW